MISMLRIRGLGVIDEALIPLDAGLTVLTGETGAGKTMVLTGLSLLAGAKSDASMVRQGSQSASVDGEWLLQAGVHADLLERLADAGAEVELESGSAQLLMSRVVASEGRSRAFAGGRSVPASVLQEAAADLIAVHGQADQMRLRQADRQRTILDRFGGQATEHAGEEYRRAFAAWRNASRELRELIASREARLREAAILRAGIEDIESAAPQPGEDVELERQAARLAHAGSLVADVMQAHDALVGGEGDAAGQGLDAMAALAAASRALDRAAAIDATLSAEQARLREVASLISDVAVELSSYADGIDADPRQQAWVEERRSALSALRRRYGGSIDDVLAWLAQARQAVDSIAGDDERIDALTASMVGLEDALRTRATELTGLRGQAASRLSARVTEELAALAMPDAVFTVEMRTSTDITDFTAAGADEVTFLLEPHPGGGARPVGRGASGGELSRVMLAIEVALAGADPVPTFVFDEVDAGVGGRAAVEVGRRLARLARTSQVLVVTHLPQVAAFADRHVVVTKDAGGLVTASSVRVVDGQDRVAELVRMLSGLEGSQAGAAHAEELLALASRERGG
ncbi:MAG: DNA repair protein RecN [Actinomycetales bacterium]|nr:DNA repair protein RecN [Actinomycetales bacterium]